MMPTTIAVPPRVHPLRKPKGFEPAVQRWSVAVPAKYDRYQVVFLGIQASRADDIAASPFRSWIEGAFARTDGPIAQDNARHVDEAGLTNHIVAAYWLDAAAFASWSACDAVAGFWDDPARRDGSCGYFRESMMVPVERQETIYWQDFPAALSRSNEVSIYPTPYCGYYGAMRDRLPIAASDSLESPLPPQLARITGHAGKGERLRVRPPKNFAVIRSGVYWGGCDDEQRDDFMQNLRAPLENGMQFLRGNAAETGCCSLRYQQTCDPAGSFALETHALGYFLSLPHLENWAERHESHHAIFSSAIARYRKYGAANQLRTWHEVYVLPEDGGVFDYINCTPTTGLLPWFEAERLH